jgi:hypothetical protein
MRNSTDLQVSRHPKNAFDKIRTEPGAQRFTAERPGRCPVRIADWNHPSKFSFVTFPARPDVSIGHISRKQRPGRSAAKRCAPGSVSRVVSLTGPAPSCKSKRKACLTSPPGKGVIDAPTHCSCRTGSLEIGRRMHFDDLDIRPPVLAAWLRQLLSPAPSRLRSAPHCTRTRDPAPRRLAEGRRKCFSIPLGELSADSIAGGISAGASGYRPASAGVGMTPSCRNMLSWSASCHISAILPSLMRK